MNFVETSDAFSIKLVRDLQVFWTEVRSHVLSSTKITAIMIDSTQLSGSSPSQQPASRPGPPSAPALQTLQTVCSLQRLQHNLQIRADCSLDLQHHNSVSRALASIT